MDTSLIIDPALSLLPDRMDSPEARALLIAIGMQESRFTHRFQVRGPARGFWQFERIGVRGVVEHRVTAGYVRQVCEALRYPVVTDDLYIAIAHNDLLAACFARLLLWQHPAPLPSLDDTEGAWAYYLRQWRPGEPRRETWSKFYEQLP